MMNARFTLLAGAVLSLGVAGGCRPSSEVTPSVVEAKPQVRTLARGRINFVEGFDNGCKIAREQGKPMLVFFTATWCHYCHAMADDAFTQDTVVNRADQFVCVLVDADAEPDVCRQFRIRGYPTVQFLSSHGAPLNRVTGKQPGHLLVMEMQAALQAVARRAPTTGGPRAL